MSARATQNDFGVPLNLIPVPFYQIDLALFHKGLAAIRKRGPTASTEAILEALQERKAWLWKMPGGWFVGEKIHDTSGAHFNIWLMYTTHIEDRKELYGALKDIARMIGCDTVRCRSTSKAYGRFFGVKFALKDYGYEGRV